MSHHANLHALCRSYCETFGVEAAWLDEGDGTTAVQMEIDGVLVTLTQDARTRPDAAFAFVEYGEPDESCEAQMLATLMHHNLMLPAGQHMRYSLHPVNHTIVFQVVLDTGELDVYSLGEFLQRQTVAAHLWRGDIQ